MGLYQDPKVKPKVFHAIENSPNQKEFKRSYLQDIFEGQATINKSLAKSVKQVRHFMKTTRESQNNQMEEVINKLKQQEELDSQVLHFIQQQEQITESLLQRLEFLEKNNVAILEKIEADGFLTQAILKQQAVQDTILSKIADKLDENEAISNQLKKQDEVYDEFASKLNLQEVFHNTVMERLDQQEGLIKKINGEIDHLRSVIYERASHIVESLEANFQRITSPIQRFFISKDEKEKEKVKEKRANT
ncbi:hypothetical protein EKG37_16245 [Robertmurraya yapensis]|uniref:Uncharacterized protein n=1 Tax=Bacillus yapensis TaxID=2492960 RepID=A0A3S0KE55_9BACI|nr:hypothetical protein [Bacillus yapensis]RTR28769.1 hypothetical protein EKG37_16245 [Bacillus yapensis]TKS94626.1 hypothetical protein FAR12_16245 [Bacillus yapensis]